MHIFSASLSLYIVSVKIVLSLFLLFSNFTSITCDWLRNIVIHSVTNRHQVTAVERWLRKSMHLLFCLLKVVSYKHSNILSILLRPIRWLSKQKEIIIHWWQLILVEMEKWLSQIICSINKQRMQFASPTADRWIRRERERKRERLSSQGLIIFSPGNNHFSSLYPFSLLHCCAWEQPLHLIYECLSCHKLTRSLDPH